MNHQAAHHPHDDVNGRRVFVSLRDALPMALALGLIVAGASHIAFSRGPVVFQSEAVIELTDEVASGIAVRSTRGDAALEIEAQLVRLRSSGFREDVEMALGEANQLHELSATNRAETPVLVVAATAASREGAEAAAAAAVQQLIVARNSDLEARLVRELEPLESQREEQLATIGALSAQLDESVGVASEDEISILRSRTSAALRRLEQYDIAIQEREFLAQSSGGQVTVVAPPTPGVERTSASLLRSVQVAVLITVLALAFAIVLGRVRGRLVLLDEVRAVAGPDIPILATVPKFRPKLRKGREALVVGRRNTRREAEAFRYMRTAIEVATDGMTPVVVAFTSSGPNEGKTVTSSNFALATARAERSVALLDGDLLNPSTGKLFGVNGSNAFVGILTGRIDPTTEQWHRVVTSGEPLDVLVSGRQLAESDRQELPTHAVEATFGKLAQMWDTVVVDCPPVLAVSDAMVLARAADVAILMVRMGHTTKRDLDKALTQLEQNQVNIAGIVVTHSTDKGESYYGYGYTYGAEKG